MKIAIVHYWLVQMRGGEVVLESLCRLFPSADIYTHVYDSESISPTISSHRIITTFINRLPFAKKGYSRYLPLMPMALESLDLSSYDLVISCESGPAKGVVVGPNAIHLSYVHTPMRYIWDHYYQYKKNAGRVTRLLMPFIAHYLRIWDVSTSMRVDAFVANSNHVSRRIMKFYHRESAVVFPPVDVDAYSPVEEDQLGDYYLWAGELVAYKKPKIAIDAFNILDKKLLVIGKGEMQSELEKLAHPNIEFLGHVPTEVLRNHMARCKALVYPGEEDFGIIPVEVMNSGRPVICFGQGGVLDTVISGKTGLYFNEQTPESLIQGVREFESRMLSNLDVNAIVRHARSFSESRFHDGIVRELESRGLQIRPEKPRQVEKIIRLEPLGL